MSFSSFFSEQARRPQGLFGRIVMKVVFDQGNAFLNRFVCELISAQDNDHIVEIGSGTGKLISMIAGKMDTGWIEGIDFSHEMVSIARKKNRNKIAKGVVKIVEGDFDAIPFEKETYSKACSVNTLYFWPSPVHTLKKIAAILKPGGALYLAFEDIEQLKQRDLNPDVFHLYSTEEVKDLLTKSGFSGNIRIESRKKGSSFFYCVVAEK